METLTTQEFEKSVFKEFRNGYLLFFGMENEIYRVLIADFIQQPADGILYDLNRLEEQITIDSRRGMNDFAMAKTVRALKDRIIELENQLMEKSK